MLPRHREHGDAPALLAEPQAEILDQRALARARHARDAHPDGMAGERQQLPEQGLRLVHARRRIAFNQGDGLGDEGALATPDARGQLLRRRVPAARMPRRHRRRPGGRGGHDAHRELRPRLRGPPGWMLGSRFHQPPGARRIPGRRQ